MILEIVLATVLLTIGYLAWLGATWREFDLYLNFPYPVWTFLETAQNYWGEPNKVVVVASPKKDGYGYFHRVLLLPKNSILRWVVVTMKRGV